MVKKLFLLVAVCLVFGRLDGFGGTLQKTFKAAVPLMFKEIKIHPPFPMSLVPFIIWKGAQGSEIEMHRPENHPCTDVSNMYIYQGKQELFKGIRVQYLTKREQKDRDDAFYESVFYFGATAIVVFTVGGLFFGFSKLFDWVL